MAPEFGVGFANYSLRTCLGKFRVVNGISSITDVRVIPPWLGRQSLVCVTQESPRGGEVDCWRNKFSLDPRLIGNKAVNDRIMYLRVEARPVNITWVQVYAPQLARTKRT